MKHQAIRPAALMLSLLLAAAPARAGIVEFADVLQTAAADGRSARPAVEFRLRAVGQGGATAVQQGPASPSTPGSASTPATTPDIAQTGTTSIISTATTAPQQGGGQVETVDLGDVTGTVCDCGEIPIPPAPKRGFPLWPLAGLAAIPLFFIPGGDDTPTPQPMPTPVPTPQPTPQPIPEPATLLLFGSGLLALGAKARRRHARRLSDEQVETTAGEV